MKKRITHIKSFAENHLQLILFIVTTVISVSALAYFMLNGLQNLGNYDAVARLNIARKITDSITPGFGQLGGIWLPFPQILMLPFVQFELLWKTGLAGAFISGAAFIIGALYLQKLAFLLTKSLKASLLVWLMFVANINILFLQTMALSETFFLMCLIMVMYFLTKWMQSHSLQHILATAMFIILITLTRYEGYFVFIGATIVILIESIRIYRKENWQKIEGTLLLFLTASGFGIFAWCVYCFLFYNDFLHWLHLYSDGKLQVSTATQAVSQNAAKAFEVEQVTLSEAYTIYTQVIQWMNGKITTMLGLFGFVLVAFTMIKDIMKKKAVQKYVPLMVISTVLLLFLIYGYQRGFIPEINLPPKLIPLDDRKSFTIYSDSNMRYGIILAPCILLLAGIAAARTKILYFMVSVLFALQLAANVYAPQTLQYSLPRLWPYSTLTQVEPFLSKYDKGSILISANAHEDFMFQTGLQYKNFIYEGSRDYWINSLNDPGMYADWVIYDDDIQGDAVYYFMTDEARVILERDFDLIYDVGGFKIWHLR
jgi:hypothetical protein